ncbi:MAG: hypothetical protein IT462_10850 [Planctomycetes bacterium]|nr:hypothetical protein [Planctomycetota bacterium]
MTIRGWTLSLMVLVTSLAATNLSAAIWDGSAGNNLWNDAANWDTNDVPDTMGEDAVFDTVSPTGNAITITSATVGMIQVNTGRTITFTITAALGVNGAAWGIDVQTGATATFTAASTFVMDVANDVRTQGTGSLTFGANIVLAFTQGSPGFNIAGGSTLNVLGSFFATLSSSISIDNNPTASVTFNNFQLGNGVAGSIFGITSSDATAAALITITGTIEIDDNSGFDEDDVNPYELRISGATIDFNSATGVVMDLETGHVNFNRAGTTTFTGGTAAIPFTCNDYTVAGGTTVVYDVSFAAAFIWIGYIDGVVTVNGTLNVGSMDVQFGGDLTLGASGVFTQSGTPGDLTFDDDGSGDNDYVILGDWSFAGPAFFIGGEWLVADNLTVAFSGNVTVNSNGSFGIGQDGATASNGSVVAIGGTLRVDVAAGLVLGEGIFNFAGNLDLGDTVDVDFVTTAASVANDFATEIHLSGAAQTIGFGPGGSMFFVNSVQAATRVTQVGGLMALGGPLDLTGATGAGTAWTTTNTIRLGGLFYVANGAIVTGNLDVAIGTLQFFEIVGASAGQRTEFILESTGTGEFNIGSITMVGDTNAATGDEDNGSNLIFRNTVVNVTNDVTLFDGNNAGNGATLTLENATLSATDILVGLGTAADADEGPEFRVTENSSVLLTGTLTGDAFSAIEFFNATVDSGDNLAYTINVVANADQLVFLNSTVTCDAAADVNIDIGGSQIYLLSSTFEHYDADGVEIKAAGTIVAFSECTFQNGVTGGTGAHITLNGLANAAKLNCDGNLFDLSTGTDTDSWANVTGVNRLHFRVTGDFGVGIADVDAALAEAYDNDGTGATEVTWEVLANSLVLADAASQPAGLVTEDTVTNQTAYNFTLTATGANSTVTAMQFEIYGEDGLGDADIATATLYQDANADGNYDAGEELGAGSLNEVVTSGNVTFTITGGVITTAAPRTWSVAVTFTAGADDLAGTITVQCIPPTGITVTEIATTVVTGLPLIREDIYVSGDLDHLEIITEPSNAVEDSAIAPAIEVALRDINDNIVLGQAINVAAAKQAGPAGNLGGTTTVATDPDTGIATFDDLSIDTAGVGFQLRFAVTSPAVNVDSVTFDITAATATLTLALAGSNTGLITDGVANQTVTSFTLDATTGNVTVTSIDFTVTLGGNLTAGDVATATLFEDADSDGQYDTGEELDAGSLNEAVAAGSVTFTLGAGELITVGVTRTWLVAITFAGGAADETGTVALSIAPGDVSVTVGTVSIVGLPLSSGTVQVSGSLAALVFFTAPSDEQEDTAISPAIVVELHDAGGNLVRGRSFNVTAAIQSGGTAGAVLGGTTTVASSATTGRATFGDLTIDLAGADYILRFAVGAITLDSAAIDINAAPGGGGGGNDDGGGCVAATSNGMLAAVAALLAALSLGAVVRLRRE